ncbi:alpha/beta hydrolase [Xanthomonas sp. 3075]|uniref:alpha/beta fold hydrolase n=1 Tax=Xanthomonas sp. 3075 TaxID=3035315 RepID=UPI0017F8E55F|nr:alpha/beta hydrolase [Xanthomonas sp. 3075]MBB4130389.1 pimeloyl-ACP methyl ester carboxylesterase [Xanthomonas sp. 3075]
MSTFLALMFRLRRWLVIGLVLCGAAPPYCHAEPAPFAFVPYEFETEHHGAFAAEVAFLEVPRRHADPTGPLLRLRVVRLRATMGKADAAPVIYLAGGPGGSGVGTARGARWPVFDQVRQHADVLLLDQRGTGLSEVPPACPHQHRFDDAQPLQRDAALAALRATVARCIGYWRANGVDLGAYTTRESADDIEDLRRALGVPHVSLWGMSYGTHLALAGVRQHGERISRVVLMGAEGPDDTLKLPLAADALLADLGGYARQDGFDDLSGSAVRVVTALRQKPALGRSFMHRGRQVMIGTYDVQLAIAASLGRRSTQQMLPLALRNAEEGNYDLLATLALAIREELGEFKAMPLAMEAASGASVQRRNLAAKQAGESLFDDALNFPFAVVDNSGLLDLGDSFRAPVQSKVPVLLIAGTLDGRTPLANTEKLLPGFPHASRLLIHDASHDDELWLGNPRIAAGIADFLAGGQVASAELSVAPPVFAKNSVDLLALAIGVTPRVVWAVIGSGATVLLGALVWLLRWRRRAKLRRLAAQR